MLQIFALAQRFADMPNGPQRDALARSLTVTAAMCDSFASRLQHNETQRRARAAALRPNHERIPILAQCLSDERCSTPMRAPAPRKRAPAPAPANTVSTKRATCDSLKRAARDFPAHPSQLARLELALAQCAEAHGLGIPNPKLRKRAADACPFAVHDAMIDFAHAPSAESLANAVSTLRRYTLALVAQHDALPERLLNPKVRAPENPAPKVHRAPVGSLDWATSSNLGTDPADIANEAQNLTRMALRDERIARKGALPTFRLLAVTKRANRVSKKWPAKLGKEVLTLKR